MVNSTLPCAEKKCKSKMTITDETDNILYYNCLEKHDEHVFIKYFYHLSNHLHIYF